MTCLISGARSIEHASLHERSARAAAALSSLGISADDVVAILLRNDFAIFEASYAATALGAFPAPINWHSASPEVRYILQDSGARVLVVHSDLLSRVREAIPNGVAIFVVPTPAEIQAAYGLNAALCRDFTGLPLWNDWISDFKPNILPAESMRGSMIYTSGTTGRPKGVRRAPPSPEQSKEMRELRGRIWGFDDCGGDPNSIVSVMTGPMYHSATNFYGLMIPYLGGKLILQPRFDAENLLALIERHKVTHLHMVPVMFNRLLALPKEVRMRYDLSSLHFVVHGAAPISVAAKQAMINWWGPIFTEYYGGTETSTITSCNTQEWSAHPGTVGKAVFGARLAILDDQGREVPANHPGEVAARLDTMPDFIYHGDEAKRASAARPGHLISIGDIGYLDDDGYLFLCDRSADIVISGGVNIYTAEIEAVLCQLNGVSDCAVIGVPDEEYGEKLCAIVQPLSSGQLTTKAITAHLKGKIAEFKIPRTIVFRESLPREDTGKIFKRRLREEFWQGKDRKIG